ncbi:MAG: alpha/beta fold hydrolase [Terracidiphilus sp.]|jgi:acetyl esterase/lipase
MKPLRIVIVGVSVFLVLCSIYALVVLSPNPWIRDHRMMLGASSVAPADLAAERQSFQTAIVANTLQPDGPAAPPPAKVFALVHYSAPDGLLAAYITPDPHDGKRHPAVLWAHGGYGGIGSFLWEKQSPLNDQSARAFREAGIVMMAPSWRGENDNPGRFEMFYGEVDDLLAARDYLAKLPYVDPDRIYLAGHSTGGTMVLLAAEKGGGFRDVFSLGGVSDLKRRLAAGSTSTAPPFDTQSAKELRLRSPIYFISSLKSPAFYFEGENEFTGKEALRMRTVAEQQKAPLQVFLIPGANHFSEVLPTTRLIAKKILEDNGPKTTISFTQEEVEEAFHTLNQP